MSSVKNDLSKCKFDDPDPHNFIDTSGKKINQKVKSISLTQKTIINPFFVGINGGSIMSVKSSDIRKNYKHVYILCLKNTIIDNKETELIMNIFNRTVDQQILASICEKFVLIKAPIVLLRNYSLKKRSNLVEGTFLDLRFKKTDGTNYDIDAIVIPMIELNETNILMYIKMHSGNMSFDQLNTTMFLTSFYSKHNLYLFDSQITSDILKIDTECYWKNSKNCLFNMNDIFMERSLSYNGHRLDLVRYATFIGTKTLNEHLTLLKTNKNYDFDEIKIKSEHMNIYQALRVSENRTFYATIDEGQFSFTKDDIANHFDKITNELYRFKLLNTFLVSKDLCHFVINNKRVLKRNADLFEKYKPLYSYLLGYAWVTFYLEESICTTKSTKNDRFVYCIDTANELPLFPFSMENVHNNPYITLLLNRDLIDPMTNYMSINALEKYKTYYGLCTREEALKRFNSFVSGKHDVNIFRDLDPKIFSFSGSVIPACLQRRSPLMDLCTSDDMNFDDIYGTYYAHYYGESDVDVMCAATTTAEFLSRCSIFLNQLIKNLDCKRENIKIIPNKSMSVIISKHFFKECIDDLNNELNTQYTSVQLIKLFETCLSENNKNTHMLPNDIVKYFYVDYVQEKNKSIKKWKTLQQINNIDFDTELVSAFNSITAAEDMAIRTIPYDSTSDDLNRRDSEIYYFVNDFRDPENQVSKEKNFLVFKFAESIKYKIQSTKLKRPIEIFKIDNTEPFSVVARFHKPCVRAYLQNNTFYMLPSFITAMMSMINIDYKYFASSQNPVDIINKYCMRGYSVILNTNEKKAIVLHNKKIDTHNGMFRIVSESQCFGPKSLNDKIYKPGVYKLNLPEAIYVPSSHTYIKNIGDLRTFYQKNNMLHSKPIFDMLEFTTISKTGNISPLQMWVADAYYEQMNSAN